MKRIIEYILFVINTIILALICYINALNIIDNYKINENEINPFLWFFIALIIILINTYFFIKQKKRILTSLLIFFTLIITGLIFIYSIRYHGDCQHEYIYKGKITFEKQDTSNTYSIAIQNLGHLIFGFENSFPDSLNKYDRIIMLNDTNTYYGDDIPIVDTGVVTVDTSLTDTNYTFPLDKSFKAPSESGYRQKSISIDCYDTIKNQRFIIEGSYICDCELGIKRIKHLSRIPVRIYKNGNLLIDTYLKITPNMVKYRKEKIEIEFDELKIKNAP